VLEAIRAGRDIKGIFISSRRHDKIIEIKKEAESRKIPLKISAPQFFNSTFGKGHQGVAAEVSTKGYISLDELLDIPLKKKEEPKKEEKPKEVVKEFVPAGPIRTKCIVEENGKSRTFIITSEPINQPSTSMGKVMMAKSVIDSESAKSTPLFHPFEGIVQVVDILVHEGDAVKEGQTVAFVEAMKAKHHIKSQVEGIVTKVNVKVGDEINSSTPIIIIN